MADRYSAAALAACALAASVAMGCSAGEATEIVVALSTDLSLLRMNRIALEVHGTGDPLEFDWSLGDDPSDRDRVVLPAYLGILPGSERGAVLIRAVGHHAVDGEVLIERQARLAFIEGRQLLLRLPLLDRCVGVRCGEDQTCGETGCQPVDQRSDELPGFSPAGALGPPLDGGEFQLPSYGDAPGGVEDGGPATDGGDGGDGVIILPQRDAGTGRDAVPADSKSVDRSPSLDAGNTKRDQATLFDRGQSPERAPAADGSSFPDAGVLDRSLPPDLRPYDTGAEDINGRPPDLGPWDMAVEDMMVMPPDLGPQDMAVEDMMVMPPDLGPQDMAVDEFFGTPDTGAPIDSGGDQLSTTSAEMEITP